MSQFQSICTLGMLVCALSSAWAQDTSTPPAEPAPESSQQSPTPAYGQDNASATDQRESAAFRIRSAFARAACRPVELLATGRDVQRIGGNERG